jgi:DNA transformation protein and related proteins
MPMLSPEAPVPSSPSFVDHVLDLLSLVGEVQARAMFGGHGLYARGVMFALVADDELFLKADDTGRPRFLEAGCTPFVYESPKGPMEMSYFRPPDAAHEDAEAMLPWARLALDAALRAQAAKVARAGGALKPAKAARPGGALKAAAKRRRPPKPRAKPRRAR